MRTPKLLAVVALFLASLPASAAPPGLTLTRPVEGQVLRGFDDVARYAAGHRGVDLAGAVGESVLVAALGVVYFAGSVAGTPSVSVDHGNGWRTTYQPVKASVSKGQRVAAGDVLGTLQAGHCAQACLHWGLTDGLDYANPLGYLGTPVISLLPLGAAAPTPRTIAAATAGLGAGRLPVAGEKTSPFGTRRHPITGVVKLHDGTDLAAACGTPITTPWDGTVTRALWSSAYGWRVFVDHGAGLVTAYNHLPRLEVRVGQRLTAGQRLGSVGTTGLSTGCHLHWMAWRDGSLIDPLTLVG